MDTLSAREDFLAAHEEIEGVAVTGIGVGGTGLVCRRIDRGHGVEGSDGQGVLVQNVKVGAVLLEDETAEVLLIGCAGTCVNKVVG